MNLKVSFSWIGLVIFALPMLINIAYVMFPPAGKAEQTAAVTHWVEIVEQISRIAYLFAVTLLVSRENLSFRSVWLFLAALFLLLYYAVWVRYFAGGRSPYSGARFFLSRCRWWYSLCCTFCVPPSGCIMFPPCSL